MTHFAAGQAEVPATGGMIAASQSLAVAAGIEILKRGGSAIDAAIAVSAAISVVEPGASHLGGDAFVITHDGKNRRQLAFNGSGAAPHAATATEFAHGIPKTGFKAATVPGLVSTWFAAHDLFGKLRFEEILEPAIQLATEGFNVEPRFVSRISSQLRNYPETELFAQLGIDTKIKSGDLLKQPDLAQSLSIITKDGRDAFYSGYIAEKLVQSSSGWFSFQDLAEHQTTVTTPLAIRYRDHHIYGQPPPSQGLILMEELLIANGFSLSELSPSARIHLMVEAKKLAFADRYNYLGDPEFIALDIERILGTENIATRRSQIDLQRANNTGIKYQSEGSDTTYFLTADRDGNAVSWIQSVFHNFGASWAIPDTGIILNNRLTGFVLDPRSPNFIEPGKRPAHTLNAWLATRSDGTLALVGGTPGANIQVQTNFQLIVNALDLKLTPGENVVAPRWQHLNKPSGSDEIENFNGYLEIENRTSPDVIKELRALGHEVIELDPFGHGSAVQLLEVKVDGRYLAASDPRAGGIAIGID